MKKILNYFTTFEKLLWLFSATAVTASFLIFDRSSFLTLAASLVGVTFLIFIAKGNPIGHVITLVFCVLYAIISYRYAYYGEVITYMFMSAPMAVLGLISWLRHPYKGNKAEVEISSISRKETYFMYALTVVVTVLFYFILDRFGTSNVIPSTFSVTTSFLAVYLSFRRSHYFALAYAANDAVLMVLWGLASFKDKSYIPVFVCFSVFLFNDLYTFFNWRRMKNKQEK